MRTNLVHHGETLGLPLGTPTMKDMSCSVLGRSTFGTVYGGDKHGRVWADDNTAWLYNGSFCVKKIRCRSYRRAVRVLRWHILGYNV